MTDAPNAQQVIYWNEGAGPTWADLQVPLDRQLAPLGHAAMAALSPKPGERILDIGCGAGDTTLELARMVAPDGRITGADISHTLLEVARRRAEGLADVRFLEADVQTHRFEPSGFDAVFSRFGVMFFADPTAAFTNIRRALKPGGRIAFVCWRTPAENQIMSLPMAAALAKLPPSAASVPPVPGAPGPFAFADPDRVRGILADAGFSDVVLTPTDMKVGGGDLEAMLAMSLKVGPLGALLREYPEHRDGAVGAVRDALADHDGPDGVKLDSATWVVTART